VGALILKVLLFVALPVFALAWLIKHFAARERHEIV
jgi:hypothetical protein